MAETKGFEPIKYISFIFKVLTSQCGTDLVVSQHGPHSIQYLEIGQFNLKFPAFGAAILPNGAGRFAAQFSNTHL